METFESLNVAIAASICMYTFKYAKKVGYPNFLGGSNLGGNLGDNNEK